MKKNGFKESEGKDSENDGGVIFESGFLKINTEDGIEIVSVEDIVFLKSLNYYTKIVLNNNKTYITTKTLKEHEKMLKNYPFFRVHQSFIININYLRSVEIKEKNVAIMQNGMEISVSRRRKDEFLQMVSKYRKHI
jgi:two-component system, LytTR family, response regulator